MAGSPREYLLIVQETAYKTPAVSPTVWTTGTTYGLSNYQALYVRLDQDNAYTVRSRPIQVDVDYGGGFAIPAYSVSDKQEVKGSLSVILTVGQAPFLLSWAGVRINTGQTAPWTTTLLPGDLISCSVYHAVVEPDQTVWRTVHLGTKVEEWDFSISEDSQIGRLTLQLVASEEQGNTFDSSSNPTAGTFPAPADNNFPIDPYVFIYAGGASYITYGGSVRTQFTELHINSKNALPRRWYATRFISNPQLVGRRTTVATKIIYPSGTSNTDRTNYTTLAAESCSIELNNGTHGVTMNLNAQNILGPFEDDLKNADLYFQASTSNNKWDATAGSDFTLTFS
jgi:hypothetical protein